MIESEKQLAVLKKRKLSFKQQQQHNTALGQCGESRASAYLISKHYQIIDTNLAHSTGEIDIVAYDPGQQELVFCEVKTRTSNNFGDASLAVNWRKIKSLQKIAFLYLQSHPIQHDFRFDLITISPVAIEHHKNITVR